MRKAKQQSGDITGDWSTTGTFLRKPSGGWLHEDRELRNGLFVNYSVQYMGSMIINSSMRTLQFNIRTQVTKEAILRLAENSGNVYIGKKKKVPKQVDKVLGGLDLRWAGEANLTVSVDSLKISSEASGMVLLNHALPSISFASGGDGATADYIGYVAKDPVHGRACHVFECPRSSQYVLATIGQAFELRYKMYLTSPRTNIQPVEVASPWDSTWENSEQPSLNKRRVTADIHPAPTTNVLRSQPNSIDEDSGGIYSDIPDLPNLPPPDSSPPPIPSARYTLAERPPGFARPHLDNPYDTMELSTTVMADRGEARPRDQASTGGIVYEDANLMEVRNSAVVCRNGPRARARGTNPQQPPPAQHEEGGEYSNTFMSIRQSRITDDLNHIDLTPPSVVPDYTNVDLPRQGEGEATPPTRRRPPKPIPFQRMNSPGQATASNGVNGAAETSSSEDHFHNNHVTSRGSTQNSPPSPQIDYDTPIVLKAKPPVKKKPVMSSHTRPGMYDDPDEIIAARKKVKPQKPARDNIVDGTLNKIHDASTYDPPEEGVYNTPEAVYDESGSNLADILPATATQAVPFSPKFDDGIYMDSNSSGAKKAAAAARSFAPPVVSSSPDPLAPLQKQRYFHGPMSRVEAEALLMKDGEFLIRESTKKPGQFVLTGMAAGKAQHLLLMDKEGRVKSKDREFESVQHLIKHFTESKLPLVIGNSQVFLKKPVINAFLST